MDALLDMDEVVERQSMKQVEQYLCAQCWQDAVSAKLKIEEIRQWGGEDKPCEWCRRIAPGNIYRITYGKDTPNE